MYPKVSGACAVLVAAALAATGCGQQQGPSDSGASTSGGDGTSTTAASQSSGKELNGFPVYDAHGWTGQSFEDQTAIVEEERGEFPTVEGSTTRGVKEKSITIAGVITKATAQGAELYPGVCEAAQARFDRANKEGGAGGRTIDFKGCRDDGGDPARNTSAVQQAVQGDGAFAIVPANSAALGGAKFLSKEHVPYMGGGVAPQELGDPFAFPPGGAFTFEPVPGQVVAYPLPAVYADALGAGDPKDLRVAFVGDDQAFVPLVAQIAKLSTEAAGAQWAYSTTSLPGPTAAPLTDYTTVVSQIQKAKPSLIWLQISSPQTVAGLVAALKAAGTPPQQIMQATFTDTRMFENPQLAQAMDGTVAFNPAAMPGSDAEGVKQMQADLKAIGKADVPVSNSALGGYAAADFMVWALENHEGELTAESFVNQLNEGGEYPGLPGAWCGLSLPLHHYTQPPCLSFAQVDAKSKTLVTKLPVTIVPTELKPAEPA